MIRRFSFYILGFRKLEAFYIHIAIAFFAISLFDIFSGIFFFHTVQGYGFSSNTSLLFTSILLSLIYLTHAFFIKPSLQLINRVGLRKPMFVSNFFLILFTLLLYMSSVHLIFLVLATIVLGIRLALYYTAFHIYFSELSDNTKQGEEIAAGTGIATIVGIFGPAIGGILVSISGFHLVFLVMSLVLLLANVPLLFISKDENNIRVDVREAMSVVGKKSEFKNNLAISGMAAADGVGAYYWPLFAFGVLAGSFTLLGTLGSVMAVVATVSALFLGYAIDKSSPKKIVNIMSLFDSLGWVLRIFASTPLGVFLLSGMQVITGQAVRINVDTLIYDRVRDEKNVGYIIQRELVFAITKFTLLVSMGILLFLGFPLTLSFGLVAIMILFTRLYFTNKLKLEVN